MGYKDMNGNKTGNGFDKNPQNINRNGRPVSFRKRYKELQSDNDGTIWIDKNKVLERTTEDGTEQIGVQVNSVDRVLFILDELIENGKGNVKLNAIKFLWEQLDGKAKQTVENQNVFYDDMELILLDDDD